MQENIGQELAPDIAEEWFGTARLAQYPVWRPVLDTWMIVGGRGSGKTRLGAEWVNALVRGYPPFTEKDRKYGQIALVGETLGDVREVMIEGPSGILSISRRNRPRYEPSRRRLVWPNGAVAQVFSSEDPESLRGPQFDAAWCDELSKWRKGEETFDMLQFGLRLGIRPQQLVTTTPKPVPMMWRLMADTSVTTTQMKTGDNAAHLSAAFLRTVRQKYAGTRLGRQELDGEMIEDREDALWSRALLESAVGTGPLDLRRIVVAVDPPAGSRRTSDACGIIVAALDGAGSAVVLHDGTMRAAKPQVAKPRPQRSPDREKSIHRRRTLAATWPMPPVMAGMLTTSQVAYARIVADEVHRTGRCELTLDEIAARGGMCRKTAKRAQDRLAELEWITVAERPVEGRKHLSNVVRIVSGEWSTWIKMGPKPRPIGGHSCPTTGNQSSKTFHVEPVERQQGAYEGMRWRSRAQPGTGRRCDAA
ncbi:hypothetical protein L598_001500000320 [Mesorhizobium sp. J18]|nr:hypothetical protein L598_001500000320 [Mesorhizobium sp. J18]